VILGIKSEVMNHFKRNKILPNFKIISEDEDKIIISTEVAYDDEILRVSNTGSHL
jgi:helix-turn-helix, type 11 domain protein